MKSFIRASFDGPYLLPSTRIANMAPEPKILEPDSYIPALLELTAAAIESYEVTGHLSSYYANADSLPYLRLLQSMPYRSAAMERRLQLLTLRLTGRPIEPSDLFADPVEANLNPDIWRPA